MGRKPLLESHQVAEAVEQHIHRTGMPPTVREIAHRLGVGSTRTIHRYLEQLEAEGWIERWAGSRGIRLLRSARAKQETVAIPLVGEAPAGPLLLAEENREGVVRVPREYVGSASKRSFLLRVRGNSMNRAMVHGTRIEDKDLVLVRQRPDAQPGEIVVALVDGEATIKRLRKAKGYAVLMPESSDDHYQPIVVGSDLTIQGVVTRVLKRGASLITE